MAGRRNYQIDRRRSKPTKQQEMDANNFGDDDGDDDFEEDANNLGYDDEEQQEDEQQEDEQQEELEQAQDTLESEEKQDKTVNEQEVEEQPDDEDAEEEEELSSNKEDSGEEYKEDSSVQEEEEEDDEEEYEPEKTTANRGRKRPPAARGRASARAKRRSYDDDDDSDSDFGQPKRRARRNAGAKKKKYQEESESEQEFESEHSDEPSPPNKKRRNRPPKAAAAAKSKPRGRPAKSKVAKRKQDDDDSEEEEEEFDEEEEDSDDSEFGTPRPKKTNKKNTRRSNRRGSAKSSEEDEEKFSNPQSRLSAASRRSTPSRFSAAIASQRLTDLSGSSEEEQDQEVKSNPKNKKGPMSSDEEFLADSESEASEEKANKSDDDSSLHDDTPATGDVGDVDDDEVGTADESSDEEELLNSPVAKKNVSQMDEISPRRSSQGNNNDDDQDSSGSEAFEAEMRRRNSRPKLPTCPSIEDAITAEPLPKRHVCYVSPDGTSRQCFSLETLRQIALKSTARKFRVDLTGDQQTFLQPPHFRTSMSDDLLDQIASRFGREALELHGEFYRRKSMALDDDDEQEDGIFVPQNSLLQDPEAFMDHLERYIDRQMGHQDIYTCPLCYSQMHRRVVETSRAKQDDDSDEERESGGFDSPVESVYDPMLVLGYLDDDNFEAASAFCFTKVAKLKVHIREDHRADTKGIQGNDMYARYKIRAPDGLLQRWLKNTNRFETYQGDMRRYWNEGNNQNFVYLLQLMQRAEIYREILQDEDDEDRDVAEDYLVVARTFFESFADRVQHDWERLSSPFLKSKGEDLKGFLVDDEDEEDEIPHFIAQRELAGQGEETSDANDLVSKIQRKYAEHEDDSEDGVFEEADEDENAGAENGEDDSDVNDEVLNGYYSEVEEQDDWVKDIKSKRKPKLCPNNVNGSATKRVGKQLTKRKSTPSPSTAKLKPEPSCSASRKLVILEDSEDE